MKSRSDSYTMIGSMHLEYSNVSWAYYIGQKEGIQIRDYGQVTLTYLFIDDDNGSHKRQIKEETSDCASEQISH